MGPCRSASSIIRLKTGRPDFFADMDSVNSWAIVSRSLRANSRSSVSWLSMERICRSSSSVACARRENTWDGSWAFLLNRDGCAYAKRPLRGPAFAGWQTGATFSCLLVRPGALRYNWGMAPARKGNRTHACPREVRSTPSRAKRRRAPIWEELLRIAKAIPKADLHKLPTDLAAHHDHYLYGSRHS